MPSPFDYIKTFSDKSGPLTDDDPEIRDYVPYVVNTGMSFMKDCVMFANEMNKCHELPNRMQHDFYYYGLPKANRRFSWIKKSEDDEKISLLCEFYKINKTLAQQYVKLLDESQVDIIRTKIQKGGRS